MIRGYASVYWNGDERTQFYLGENHVERIMPGSFSRALEGTEDVVGLFNHDPSLVLGRTSSGTMRLSSDQRGLFYAIESADTQISRDVTEHQNRGDVIGSSFGFQILGQEITRDDGLVVREIHEVSLRDVGPVTWPAYSGTEDVRMVSPDGYCMMVPDPVACHARSLMVGTVYSAMVRARKVEIDNHNT